MLEPAKWVERYADSLLRHTLFRVKDLETAEDIVQDVFLSAYKSRDNYTGAANEKTWLFAILKNKIIDHYRSKLHKLSQLTEPVSTYESYYFNETDDDHWHDNTAPRDWASDAISPWEQKELNAVLHDCIGKLPEKMSAVFSLKFLEDADTEKICKDLQITSSNYWVLMHRAKLQLRECIEKNWFTKS
jgi:RNA polymerase sigma-70 factor (ECF subfamily)